MTTGNMITKPTNLLHPNTNLIESCPICTEQATITPIDNRDAFSVFCPFCGEYSITTTALVNLKNSNLTLRQKRNISGWLRENPHYDISSSSLNNLEKIPTPTFHDKADKLLLHFAKMTSFAGKKINKDNSWISFCWCINQEELNEILSFLVSEGRISQSENLPNRFAKIEPPGWSHIENLKNTKELKMELGKEFHDIVHKLVSHKQAELSQEQLQRKDKIVSDLAGKGWNSMHGPALQKIDELQMDSIQRRGDIVWSSLKQTLEAVDLSFYPELSTQLHSLAESFFPLTLCEPHEYEFEHPLAENANQQLRTQLKIMRDSSLDIVKTKIDLYVAKKRSKSIGGEPLQSGIFNKNTFGNNTNIIVGNHNKQEVSNVNKGDFQSLANELRQHGVQEDDITALEKAISTDKETSEIVEKGKFGSSVKKWLQIMFSKAVDSSWQIELGIVSNILTAALQKYYG